jgi:hypothetical protein
MAAATPSTGKKPETKTESNPTVNKPIPKGTSKTSNGAKRVDH